MNFNNHSVMRRSNHLYKHNEGAFIIEALITAFIFTSTCALLMTIHAQNSILADDLRRFENNQHMLEKARKENIVVAPYEQKWSDIKLLGKLTIIENKSQR